MVHHLSTAEEFEKSLASSKLVIVDFFATWCGPCKMIAPLLEKFADQHPDAEFYKVDVDELNAVALKHSVTAMPTIVFYKDGKEIDRVLGANPGVIKAKICSNLDICKPEDK